ncbi:MAG TPA: acyl-CoA dehydrogenase family protein [Kofleriaceae bacterium]|nr:acyl-CoA dehydrogenase family protein [Kofleriaceae bacterium]
MAYDYQAVLESVAATTAAHAAEVDRGTFPTAALAAMRDHGLLGLVSSTDVGGHGRGLREAAVVVERLARECASTAMVACMHYVATTVIELSGPRRVRGDIAAGRHLTTLAFSELGSRSQFWAPLGTARSDGTDVWLTARKSWVTSARHARSYVWSSKPLAGSEASTLWLVPANAPGLRIADAGFDGLGLRGNDSSPITAEDARVPTTARLGTDGGGFATMMSTVLPWFNVLSAAVSAGLMESAVQKTAAHVGTTQFQHAGHAIADLPTVRAYVARMRIATDQTKALLADTLAAIESQRADAMLRVLESKAAAGESATVVTDLAMRVCGGAAFRKEVGVERVFRDARAALVMGPTTDVLYDFIGKAVCGLPLF